MYARKKSVRVTKNFINLLDSKQGLDMLIMWPGKSSVTLGKGWGILNSGLYGNHAIPWISFKIRILKILFSHPVYNTFSTVLKTVNFQRNAAFILKKLKKIQVGLEIFFGTLLCINYMIICPWLARKLIILRIQHLPK